MAYPFPGMNPWLENPTVWKGIHQRLITSLADILAPQLEPRYFVAVETHTLFFKFYGQNNAHTSKQPTDC